VKDSAVLKFLGKKFGGKYVLSAVHTSKTYEECHYPGPSRVLPHRDVVRIK
jgi:hypothetical protein